MGMRNLEHMTMARLTLTFLVLVSITGSVVAEEMVPNRTVPNVTRAPLLPVFSDPPTDHEIFRARIFEEPLLAVSPTTSTDNIALADALTAYLGAGGGENTAALEAFLDRHPASPWAPSLRLDLGIVYRRTGYWTRALEQWEESWASAKLYTAAPTSAIGDRAAGELAQLAGRLGRYDRLEALFAEIEASGRDVRGPAHEKLIGARQGLWMMHNRPEIGFLCGPLGIDRILSYDKASYSRDPRLLDAASTMNGTSLLQNRVLSDELGLGFQSAYRGGAEEEILVPALVHWKAGHFAALVDQRDGRYLLQDPTFGEEMWISRAALDDQSSGYFLVPGGPLPHGWRPVDDEEAATVWGKGYTDSNNHDNQKCGDNKSGGCGDSCPKNNCCGGRGMASYSFHTMLTALHIVDTPVGYSPPVGPSIEFQLGYHHREVFQPQTFFFSNFGPMWTFDWISWVEDDPADASQPVGVYQRGGGREVYTGYDPGTDTYEPHPQSRAVTVRTSEDPIRYEVRWPNGSVDFYEQPDGALAFPRKVLMTRTVDPQGNEVDLTWDEELRLVAITDAIGQVTTLAYELPGDPLRITRVTDPFGRFATFEYEEGRLAAITDVIGLVSSFDYGEGDFIEAMTTPYGTTTFAQFDEGRRFWIEATDPLGATERLEYVNGREDAVRGDEGQLVMPDALPAGNIPQGFSPGPLYPNLKYRNTFYWSKLAHARHPGDYSMAKMTHWLHQEGVWQTSGVIENEKEPLESKRIYYKYSKQPALQTTGTHATPSGIGRVLDDGSDQIWTYDYNSAGKKILEIDPLGRETMYIYGSNNTPDADSKEGRGIDLLEIRQKNGAAWDTLETRTYNTQHLPLTVTDAAGQTTAYAYNPAGQIETVTTPERAGITENRTTTYSYDEDGFLESITGPATGATTGFTYDAIGRLKTTTTSDGDTVMYDYDNLDRVTKVTYPDGTYDETIYERLDPVRQRDRLGRWTETLYNALRLIELVRDAEGRTVNYQWCDCGALEAIVDDNGNATTWVRDAQGRVTSEVRADGAIFSYDYEDATSRLESTTDANGQTTRYAYNLDNTIAEISYEDAVVPTPSVSYTYDPVYTRVETMTDGTGITTCNYHPVGVLGAGRLSSVDGPLADDTVAYAYDELGRVVGRGLTTFPTTTGYDVLGRIESVGSPVGSFTWGYDGVTSRPQTLDYPNGQTTTYTYLDGLNDRRLGSIRHEAPDDSLLSEFAYTYDAVRNISTWQQQWAPDPPQVYDFGYDRVDQLTSAVLQTTDPTPTVLKRYGYVYDLLGNRTAYQEDDAVTASAFNSRNQLVSSQPGGALLFRGATDEPAMVTVDGVPAVTAADDSFAGHAGVAEGTDTVEIQATDPSGNVRTATYQVSQIGPSTSYTYDANGNLTSDAARTYEWDAADRLVRVMDGPTEIASFFYDGHGRRVQKTAGGVTRTYLYDAEDIVEEHLGTGEPFRYVHGPGIDQPLAVVQSGALLSLLLSDHLGSIVQITDAEGVEAAKRKYDPFGNADQTVVGQDFAFNSREWDPATNLYFYRARYYDPPSARFLSEDLIQLVEQPNLYSYVGNSPVGWQDPLGLSGLRYPLGGPDAIMEPSCPNERICPCDTTPKGDFENFLLCIVAGGNVPTVGSAASGGMGATGMHGASQHRKKAIKPVSQPRNVTRKQGARACGAAGTAATMSIVNFCWWATTVCRPNDP